MNEILDRQSEATHKTYRPASTGLTEARYPNMVKIRDPTSMDIITTPYGPGSYTKPGSFGETDGSYRSASPTSNEPVVMNSIGWEPSTGMHSTIDGPGSPQSGHESIPSPQYSDVVSAHGGDTLQIGRAHV